MVVPVVRYPGEKEVRVNLDSWFAQVDSVLSADGWRPARRRQCNPSAAGAVLEEMKQIGVARLVLLQRVVRAWHLGADLLGGGKLGMVPSAAERLHKLDRG